MICPHCARDAPASVLETRQHEGVVYRTRLCGGCESRFVSHEHARVGMSMPQAVRSPRLRRAAGLARQAVQQASRHTPVDTAVFGVWG